MTERGAPGDCSYLKESSAAMTFTFQALSSLSWEAFAATGGFPSWAPAEFGHRLHPIRLAFSFQVAPPKQLAALARASAGT
jgi:hypothetical protein